MPAIPKQPRGRAPASAARAARRPRRKVERVPRRFPKAISTAKGRALINVSNKTPKTMDVLLTYKNMLRITQNSPDVAQAPLASGFPFRISMNSPFNPQGEILHVHTTGHGTQTYATTTVPNNLTAALADTGLPDRYSYFYIKRADVTVVVQNQINQEGLRSSFDNETMTPPTGSDQATHLVSTARTLTGELVNCAHVTEDNSFNLNPLTVANIRENISGSQVKESLVFPDSRGTSNVFRFSYRPRSRFDMADVRDNLGLLRMTKDGSIGGTHETHFNMCVGKQLFPSTQLLDSALQTVDIEVKYLVCAFERISGLGSNDPIPLPHAGDL